MQTNWSVITGPPSSGKTSLIDHLNQLGYSTISDPARTIALKDPSCRNKPKLFQEKVNSLSIRQHEEADPNSRIFLDYGLPDNLVYQHMSGIEIPETVHQSKAFRYRSVFFLPPLPFTNDGVRDIHASQIFFIANLMLTTYKSFGYFPKRVPRELNIKERAKYVLKEDTAR